MLKSGKAKVKDWQGVVEVRVQPCPICAPSRSVVTPPIQFAFHAAMIRDSLAELVHANHVDLLKKVRLVFAPRDLNNDTLQS